MKNFRKYGEAPFRVAVVHGGPGASGEMAPVARELSMDRGVLEPLQTATSLPKQIKELKATLKNHGKLPITLIGHSWGAWLACMLAAKHPSLVKKLILVGTSPFEAKYARNIMKTRLDRLDQKGRLEVLAVMEKLDDPAISDKNMLMAELGKLISRTDSYDALPDDNEPLEYEHRIYQRVRPQAAELRRSGRLLRLARKIKCPVVAIHGDYDPHPPEGVKEPLSKITKDFRLILLKNCGHKPWIERNAKDRFYEILKEEL